MKHPDFDKVYGPDQVSIWHYVWPSILIFVIFLLSFLALAYLPDFNEWMDKTFDKSDQMRTGIVLLCLGLVSFSVLFLSGCLKRNQ